MPTMTVSGGYLQETQLRAVTQVCLSGSATYMYAHLHKHMLDIPCTACFIAHAVV
jgi:hypothetical protein